MEAKKMLPLWAGMRDNDKGFRCLRLSPSGKISQPVGRLLSKMRGAPQMVQERQGNIMSRNRLTVVIIVLGFCVVISGCGEVQLFEPSSTPTASRTPEPTNTPTLTSTPTFTPTPTETPMPTQVLEYKSVTIDSFVSSCDYGISLEIPSDFLVYTRMDTPDLTSAFLIRNSQYEEAPAFDIIGTCVEAPILIVTKSRFEKHMMLVTPFSSPYATGYYGTRPVSENDGFPPQFDLYWEVFYEYHISPFLMSYDTLAIVFTTNTNADQDLIWHIINSVNLW
jgi:hypothetical protein